MAAWGVLGLGIGISVLNAAGAEEPSPSPTYKVNESGQTIGPWIGGQGAFRPDLVEIVADNGNRGYSRTDDMIWEPATSPEDAVRITREHVNEQGFVVVPVYAEDGKTKIGEATIAQVSEKQTEE